jgi:hypothetical protein
MEGRVFEWLPEDEATVREAAKAIWDPSGNLRPNITTEQRAIFHAAMEAAFARGREVSSKYWVD